MSALYWNYSGFDAAGAYAGEIHSPKTTYPRAMILCVVMIAFTYIVPFIAISGADKPHYTTWDDGSYSVIAQAVGGTWLCVWIVVSSLFGNLGLYVAEMAKDGFQLAGMADSGLAPPFFAQYVFVIELYEELYWLGCSLPISLLYCVCFLQTRPGERCAAPCDPAVVHDRGLHGAVQL